MKIESTDKEVRSILQSGYYRIPRFQRPYSWEKDHIQDFWDDIVIDNEDDYFIGSMVVYKQQKGYFGIVDGQQRMTTITIFLCVLRNIMSELGLVDSAEGIHSLIERKNIDNVAEYILTSESSYPFLQEHIQKFGDPDLNVQPLEEEKTLQNAFKQAERLIKGLVDSIKVDTAIKQEAKQERTEVRLRKVRDCLLDLKVIFIELDDEDDAYLIFETLNTRGKDLNTSDLVKNHLTKLIKAGNANVDATKEKWADLRKTIEESEGDIEIDPFLHTYWLSKYDFVTQKKLFKEIKKKIDKDNAKQFLESLLCDAKIYRSIFEPSYRTWKKEEAGIIRSLDALNLFRVKLQVPTVLSVLRSYFGEGIKKASTERAISSIAKFHFIFTAVTSQRSSGGISQMYASVARKLASADDTQARNTILNDFKAKLREKIPSQSEFDVNFEQIVFTKSKSKQKKLVQYILSEIHRYEQNGIPVDYSQMTIEHIYPESPKGFKKLPDTIIGQLGNLILIDQDLNDKLANKSFVEKKEILEEAKIPLDESIRDSEEWSEEQIKIRTAELAKRAYENVWKI
ncbi:DUF262 domain-containing HNH endonuclease family protein [Aestuariirhabdus sp. Z084]|uniref:DUF262 domain-containing protein n=1 Tax=Aestuariirhabdus haliotis TaxID=2918751 RepID=UPI00201B3EBA|nr:DUF262 domain-containing protein [Aestuariirhabdus haliotis]MCL6417772.1 DUF262 domain-containing HNH endonuclease family protein [Aestuariirhabdus haliotis]MCL6421705.1 DUF262 domain-containing HNH endonuclease family protein [Aestuariirhabdus haliotis]